MHGLASCSAPAQTVGLAEDITDDPALKALVGVFWGFDFFVSSAKAAQALVGRFGDLRAARGLFRDARRHADGAPSPPAPEVPGAADLSLRGWAWASLRGASARSSLPALPPFLPGAGRLRRRPWAGASQGTPQTFRRSFFSGDRSGDWKKFQIVREKSMQLLLKTAEKILEHKKQPSKICTPWSGSKKLKFFILRFGQDLLTCDECSSKDAGSSSKSLLARSAAGVVVEMMTASRVACAFGASGFDGAACTAGDPTPHPDPRLRGPQRSGCCGEARGQQRLAVPSVSPFWKGKGGLTA